MVSGVNVAESAFSIAVPSDSFDSATYHWYESVPESETSAPTERPFATWTAVVISLVIAVIFGVCASGSSESSEEHPPPIATANEQNRMKRLFLH